MPFTTNGKNTMLDAFGITHAALFDGDPESGGTEATGGGYAREAVTFSAAASGAKAASSTPNFDVPAGFTVRYVGWYDDDTAGTLLAKSAVAELAYPSAGTYTLNSENFSIT